MYAARLLPGAKVPQPAKRVLMRVLFVLYLGRRPLEEIKGDGKVLVAASGVVPAGVTTEERMTVIHAAASIYEILRTTLRRGAYFKGAAGVHDCVDVHRAALRGAATLMRKVLLVVFGTRLKRNTIVLENTYCTLS